MHSVTEREYPVDYVHSSGEQAKIDFIWGELGSLAPVGLTVWLKSGSHYVKLGEEVDSWSTFCEARRRGIELASKWLERGN